MQLALYCPVYGYYERDADTVGRAGDYQTSVCVGPVFGELLARRVVGWLDQLRQDEAGDLQLVEAGAHDGRLAGDLLGYIQRNRSDWLGSLHYDILEPSVARQERQRAGLVSFLPHLRWHSSWDALQRAAGGVRGVIFSNELLDAQPVHRLVWDRARSAWFEWRVGIVQEQFGWVRSDAPTTEFVQELARCVPPAIGSVLPDGYVVELSPAAEHWWKTAGGALRRGWLLTFDYGFDDDAAFLPERTGGTLRGYRRHRVVADVLEDPGAQDLTAHVHFGRIRRAGEAVGLRTDFYGEQGRFLTQCAADFLRSGEGGPGPDAAWLRQFKTLIHPDHFGRSFRALVQSRLE